MSDRPTITAALITLDEERNLAELLPRLEWVDEVVVVDGGSRDGTVAVARRHGCRVVSRRFDDFAAQRNLAIRLARGDWIFSIDADERPTPRLVSEIRRRIAGSRFDAYRVPIRSTIFGRPLRRSGTQDDRPVRLVRRTSARWVGRVHEVLRVKGRVGRLDSWLTHRTQENLRVFLTKMHCYARLEAQARVAAGRPPRRRDVWLAPPREVFRRLVWKQGLFDGPAGWAFSVLSGLCECVLAREHRRTWDERDARTTSRPARSSRRPKAAGSAAPSPSTANKPLPGGC
jgi:glycosyltransferase involved in cell wall biosynthesis